MLYSKISMVSLLWLRRLSQGSRTTTSNSSDCPPPNTQTSQDDDGCRPQSSSSHPPVGRSYDHVASPVTSSSSSHLSRSRRDASRRNLRYAVLDSDLSGLDVDTPRHFTDLCACEVIQDDKGQIRVGKRRKNGGETAGKRRRSTRQIVKRGGVGVFSQLINLLVD